MRIIRMTELTVTRWKNGGGVTREIAIERRGETLVWRLSMADVASDGPFSNFAGLQRILTVINGVGMDLLSPLGILHADYGRPVRFDGGMRVEAKLRDGPIRDFNLIFDPLFCIGEISPLVGPHRRNLYASPHRIVAIHGLYGTIELDQDKHLHVGDTALIESGGSQLNLASGVSALLITLVLSSQADASKVATAER